MHPLRRATVRRLLHTYVCAFRGVTYRGACVRVSSCELFEEFIIMREY